MVGNCGSGAACFAHHGWRTHHGFHSTNCKMVLQCAPMFSAECCPLLVFCPFVRRAAMQRTARREVRHCILLCTHFHSSVQGNRWIGQPWPINFLFASFARETLFSWNVEEMAKRTISDIVRITVKHVVGGSCSRSAAWFENSSIPLHGCRSHYGR